MFFPPGFFRFISVFVILSVPGSLLTVNSISANPTLKEYKGHLYVSTPSSNTKMLSRSTNFLYYSINTGSRYSRQQPFTSMFFQNSEQNSEKNRAQLSPADLRLSPILPGPRFPGYKSTLNAENSGLMGSIRDSPGYAFLASLMIPGLGQAANQQWWKTALFTTMEATAIGIFIHRENRGRDGERHYQEYGNNNWSVVQYARYIVDNHHQEHGYDLKDLINKEVLDSFMENNEFIPEKVTPAFDIDYDWNVINIAVLREAESNSRYANGNVFSHNLPDYGSQQYYELMSKYFQYGPGWRQWNSSVHSIDEEMMPDDFIYHAQIGFDFNNDLRVARNMLTLLIVNHFVAAFDAYFTQLVGNAKIQPTTSMEYGIRPTFGFNYRF